MSASPRITPLTKQLATDRPYFAGFSPEGLPTPCFVIDRAALAYNLDILGAIGKESNTGVLLALKAFALPTLGKQITDTLAGTTASGLFEARLARDHLGKEIHVYSPAYTDDELDELLTFAHGIIFNNLRQWERAQTRCMEAQERREDLHFSIRINPEHSEGTHAIYDPCAPRSRLGITRAEWNAEIADARARGRSEQDLLCGISGLHMHTLCEQGAAPLERTLRALETRWQDILARPGITNFNMGGGHHITKPDYDRTLLARLLLSFQERFSVHTYIEPGEAAAIHSGILVTRVLDIHRNELPIAILDTAVPCHMPDVLEMPYTPDVWGARAVRTADTAALHATRHDAHTCILAGRSCLAGDILGTYQFSEPLNVGDMIIIDDMAHYTFVKTNTFNGVPLPAIALFDSRTGELSVACQFGYADFISRLM
ncbi:MAG: carboxynorspermidine decarboxylase [Spirochaetota bacterium]|jgi:carboxynorspermidine decarboxylase|nr:carboxynorspermidine decarboxylase [Spirochaetota bacterium]